MVPHDMIQKCSALYLVPHQSGWNGQKLPGHVSSCQERCGMRWC